MRFNALDALFSIRKEDSEDLRSFMTRAEAAMNTYKSLIPTDSTFTLQSLQDELVTMSLIHALPDEFNHVRATLGVHTNLTLAVTQQAFIAEDNQRQRTAQPTNTALRTYTHYHQCSNVPSPMPPSETQSDSRTCYYCQKQGHIARHCRKKAADAKAASDTPPAVAEAFAVNASTIPIPAAARSDLNCDTGATSIITM
jgi:hypothetical protein